jgi:3'-phosphoadenosine 5'-phosphosulfate sulfotransferase (PAPS reductase)/FAD synthetase
MRAALQFSGGIDSLACLLLLRKMPDLTVYWVKTDGAYADTEPYIKGCCEFVNKPLKVVSGDRQISVFGYPADSNPVSAFQCCFRARGGPLYAAMLAGKVTDIYRGDRDNDLLQSTARDLDCIDGITYHRPIAKWTRLDALAYCLKEAPQLVPDYYLLGEESSHDCWDCPAYIFQNEQRIMNLPAGQREFVLEKINGPNEPF